VYPKVSLNKKEIKFRELIYPFNELRFEQKQLSLPTKLL
jgi:hypothetical protein